MLVLSRKKEEKLQIGENIVITILKVKGSSVQIGIEAPRSVRVLRAELAGRTPNPGGMVEIDVAEASPTQPGTSDRTSCRPAPRGPLRSLVNRSARENDAPASAIVQLV